MHDFQHYHAQFDSRITALRDQLVHRMHLPLGRFGLSSLTRLNREEAVSDGLPEGIVRLTGVHVMSVSRALGRFFSAEVSLSEFLAGRQADFLRPSVGIEFQKNRIRAFANQSMTSRFPGLNDVYWTPGGNPNLRPERGSMSEVGFDWKTNIKKSRIFSNIQLSGTGHQGLITDMILWQPTGAFWSAFNIQSAQLRGAEWQANLRKSSKNWSWELHGVYAYTESIDRSTGRMLPYVAKHAARGSFGLSYQGLSSFINVRHNGQRPVGMLFMPPHTVADLSVAKVFSLRPLKMTTGLSIMNLTDINYQVMAYMPMPGRHAMFNLSISW
jgi:outer membrane cobalamin receptor